LISSSLMKPRISFKQTAASIGRLLFQLKLLKDKRTISLISVTILMAVASYATLHSCISEPHIFRSSEGRLIVDQFEWKGIEIDGLRKGDQVMVELATNTWLDAEVASDGSIVQVESGVVNPYNLKGSFNETMLFFVADSESCSLMLRMKHPNMPFRVTDGLDSDLDIDVTSRGSSLLLELNDEGLDGHGSLLRMAYPCRAYVGDDFSLTLKYRVVEGGVSNVLLDVFDEADEWLYAFDAPEDFVLKPHSRDVHGHSNLLNDPISLVAMVILLDDGSSATIRLDELSISDGESRNIEFYAESCEEVRYEVFIERDFEPTPFYIATLILSVAFGFAAVYNLYGRIEVYADDGFHGLRRRGHVKSEGRD
jgi:hypothetical protein